MTKPRRGRFARCFAQAALALALAPVYAQSPQPSAQAEVSTHEAPLTFKTKVNLVSIPVVVRDAKGRAVGNLSRDDFQITDNGKRQAISRFSIERFGEKEPAAPEAPAMQTRSATGTLVPSQPAIDSTRPRAPQLSQSQTAEPAQPPATPERFVAYVFDDVNTKANDLAQAREAAYQHMITSLRPTERAAVYTTSGQGGADFTDDRDKLRKAMRGIRPQNPITQSSDCPPMTVYQAERISKDDVEALGAAMADIQTCSIQDQATGEEEWKARNAARAVLAIADRNINTVLAGLDGIVKKLSLMAGRRTMVLVSSGFVMLDDRRQDETAVLERALKAGIVVNTLDARALWALAPGLDASAHTIDTANFALPTMGAPLSGGSSGTGVSTLLVKGQMARAEAFANRDVMAEIAANTGGRFFENSNDLSAGFERLATAPDYIFVLGFAPQDLKLDGKYHSLKVTLRNSKGLTLEARRGYYAPSYAKNPAERGQQEIEEAFFSRAETNDIPVAMQTQFSKTSDRQATVSVAARIDVRQLPFRKEGQVNRDDVTVVAGLFDGSGNYIKGTQKVLEMRVSDQTLRGTLEQGYTVKDSFTVPPGTYVVRLVVRDSEGQNLTSHTGSVTIP